MDDTDCPDPLLVDYDISVKKSAYGVPTGEINCSDPNEGCAKWNCECDKNFAKQIVELVGRDEFDPSLVHAS